jgi:hypothetical protein
VTVSGSGFGSFEEIRLSFASTGPTVPLGRATSDGTGRFAIDVVIPAGASRGRHDVVALGSTSGLRAVATFRVT